MDSVETKISQLSHILNKSDIDAIGLDSMNKLLIEFKEYADCLYYTTKWNLVEKEENWNKRVEFLKEISLYPYFQVKNIKLNYNARILYEGSLVKLINEYGDNLDLLNSIKVYEAYKSRIYPFLKQRIIAAGGNWVRGEIPNYQFRN